MHEDLKTATNNVNYWFGATTLMPLIEGFVADAYTGRFHMILFSSFIYLKVYIFFFNQCAAYNIACNERVLCYVTH